MKHKTLRIEKEFKERIHPVARAFLYTLDELTRRVFSKEITITELIRTELENTEVKGRKFSSHLTARGMDIRSKNFEVWEIDIILRWTKLVWGDVIHIIYDMKGTAPHIHANVNWKYAQIKSDI